MLAVTIVSNVRRPRDEDYSQQMLYLILRRRALSHRQIVHISLQTKTRQAPDPVAMPTHGNVDCPLIVEIAMKIDLKAFALACSIFWGAALFLVTWWIILLDGASGDPTWLSRVYRGYSISVGGSFIGLAWGLLDGLIGGAVLAWLYNRFAIGLQ